MRSAGVANFAGMISRIVGYCCRLRHRLLIAIAGDGYWVMLETARYVVAVPDVQRSLAPEAVASDGAGRSRILLLIIGSGSTALLLPLAASKVQKKSLSPQFADLALLFGSRQVHCHLSSLPLWRARALTLSAACIA